MRCDLQVKGFENGRGSTEILPRSAEDRELDPEHLFGVKEFGGVLGGVEAKFETTTF